MPRPPSIPKDEVLKRALLVFWHKGFDCTSINDLSRAIGLGPSSIYNTFGSKDALFQMAIELYMKEHAGMAAQILSDQSDSPVHETIKKLLRFAAKLYTMEDTPKGCAMMEGGGAGTPAESKASAFTLTLKRSLESSLKALFQRRQAAGDNLSASPKTLARFVLGTMRGLSQFANDGLSRRELLPIADHAANSCVA